MSSNTKNPAGAFIKFDEAKKMNEDFVKTYPDFTKSVLFDNELLLGLIGQEGCVGVRVYFGMEEDAESKLKHETVIFVGVDVNGDDLKESLYLERGDRFPTGSLSL